MGKNFLPGFPDGAIKIGAASILKKEGTVTYFTYMDNMFSHAEGDKASFRYAICMMISNGHLRAVDVEKSELAIPKSTIMKWLKQYREKGPSSFFVSPKVRGKLVITDEIADRCARLLESGESVAEVARIMGINESTLRKAFKAGRIKKN